MQYINKNLNFSLDFGSNWDYGFNYSYSNSNNNSSGKAIWEGEFIALAWADIYLLNPIINKAKGAVFIGGRRGSID